MSGAGLAGLLREQVTVSRGDPVRDAQGGVSGDTTVLGIVWAGCVPDGERRWRIAMRPFAVEVGDRIGRVRMVLRVVCVLADPRMPDRITLFAEETP